MFPPISPLHQQHATRASTKLKGPLCTTTPPSSCQPHTLPRLGGTTVVMCRVLRLWMVVYVSRFIKSSLVHVIIRPIFCPSIYLIISAYLHLYIYIHCICMCIYISYIYTHDMSKLQTMISPAWYKQQKRTYCQWYVATFKNGGYILCYKDNGTFSLTKHGFKLNVTGS